MGDSSKIHIDDLHVGLRPEEIDSILGLRNTYDYFELLGSYVSSYLDLGWLVKLVIPQFDVALDIDLREVREVWHQGLTNLALKGIHACLMVYTGGVSNLLVLEVTGKSSEKNLALGRDWRAACIIQLGPEREQHFYTWPDFLTIPAQTTVDSLDLQVFGEGGKVALPPSLPAGSAPNCHWLVPPWENPPGPPSPRLLEFLRSHFPSAAAATTSAAPELPSWDEVLRWITPHPRLMQALLTAGEPEGYYRTLLKTAHEEGLVEPHLLLGLLWHAPLGAARQQTDSLPWFNSLIQKATSVAGSGPEQTSGLNQVQQQLADLLHNLSETVAGLRQERQQVLKESFRLSHDFSGGSEAAVPGAGSRVQTQARGDQESWPAAGPPLGRPLRPPMDWPAVSVFQSSPFATGEIPVNRKQYEAMIYELGRLAAMEKLHSRSAREANSLKAKIDAQRQAEVDHLRQLVRDKQQKKWWERS